MGLVDTTCLGNELSLTFVRLAGNQKTHYTSKSNEPLIHCWSVYDIPLQIHRRQYGVGFYSSEKGFYQNSACVCGNICLFIQSAFVSDSDVGLWGLARNLHSASFQRCLSQFLPCLSHPAMHLCTKQFPQR